MREDHSKDALLLLPQGSRSSKHVFQYVSAESELVIGLTETKATIGCSSEAVRSLNESVLSNAYY